MTEENSEKEKYDLIIIGSGPAGLTAGVYAGRYMLNTLIIGQLPGGTAGEAHEVCNFPSYDKINGFELMHKMTEQVKNLEVGIKNEEVIEISGENNDFIVKTNKAEYKGKKIIIATGTKRRKLEIGKEDDFLGKGISYCATCDAGFYKDKDVGVVGGGNAALTAALLLSKFANNVYIIYRKDSFKKAEPAWVKDVEENEKIKPLFNKQIKKILGEEKLEGVEFSDGESLNLDGMFIEVGSVSNKKLAEILGTEIDENEFIKIDKKQKTSCKGVFAAGDVTNNPLKQIVTACAEGAIAATSAYEELGKKE